MAFVPSPKPATSALPDYLVCPHCHGKLTSLPAGAVCTACERFFPRGATLYFADTIDDREKARQRAIYEGDTSQALMELPYQELEGYRQFCASVTDLICRHGYHGYQFKALKTRALLDQMEPQPQTSVLDIGSGDGSLLALLTQHYGVQGIGIDLSATVVERSVQVNPWGHEYYQGDAEQLPFRAGTFDGVVSMDVLEHLPHPQRCIAEAGRVLRPGGWALFYAVSQRDDYTWHWMQRRLSGGTIGMDSGAGHRWENFLQPTQARRWMEEAGFSQVQMLPFHALATLILDERFVPFFAAHAGRPRLLRWILRLAEAADRPLTSRGFGNGFYLSGHKED